MSIQGGKSSRPILLVTPPSPHQQEKVKGCLEILKFSMVNTIVSFREKCYEYRVDPDPNCCGLTIGGFKSAFIADVDKAMYIFEKLHHLLEQHIRLIGPYRDDMIIMFRGNKSNEWLKNWLTIFQKEVDRLLGTTDIQFTTEIWRPGSIWGPLPNYSVSNVGIETFNTMTINGNYSFPYLDFNLLWNKENNLLFSAHKKPGKLVKYLNSDSHHHWHHNTTVSLVSSCA
jgi:hypothetical protein